MADRNADNDNKAGTGDDNWVMPIPATGSPAYALMPWALFERLRAPLTASADGLDAAGFDPTGLDDAFDSAPIREIGAAPMRVAPADPWPRPGGELDGYADEAAAGAIPLDLLDRLLDGEHPLKVFRRHRGLTQKQLAERTGLNATYLSQIETRKRGGSTRVYRLLAAALNVEIGDLIE